MELSGRVERTLMTPEIAKHFRVKLHPNQRKLSRAHVGALADQIERGLWREGMGEPVAVSKCGMLLNGNHRLAAIEKANKAVWLNLRTGCDPDDYEYYDQGRQRTMQQLTGIHPAIMGVVNQAWRFKYGTRLSITPDAAYGMAEAISEPCKKLNIAGGKKRRVITTAPVQLAAIVQMRLQASDPSYVLNTYYGMLNQDFGELSPIAEWFYLKAKDPVEWANLTAKSSGGARLAVFAYAVDVFNKDKADRVTGRVPTTKPSQWPQLKLAWPVLEQIFREQFRRRRADDKDCLF